VYSGRLATNFFFLASENISVSVNGPFIKPETPQMETALGQPNLVIDLHQISQRVAQTVPYTLPPFAGANSRLSHSSRAVAKAYSLFRNPSGFCRDCAERKDIRWKLKIVCLLLDPFQGLSLA